MAAEVRSTQTHSSLVISWVFFIVRYNNIVINKFFCFPRYQNMFICDMRKMQADGPFPHYPSDFTERLQKLCAATRAELVDNWLIDVADIMVKMRHHWAVYVAKERKASTFQVEMFFG